MNEEESNGEKQSESELSSLVQVVQADSHSASEEQQVDEHKDTEDNSSVRERMRGGSAR